MRGITFELCAETLQACLAAREGGADRIELCSALSEEGLTPSHAFIKAAVERSGLPVHVLLRPRAGDFQYSEEEFALMREDLLHARSLGTSGFALGFLHADGAVNVERTRALVELAAPLDVTFHRAFDVTPSLDAALEDVIAAGCGRVLTSGGKRDVAAGASRLARLVERAAGRIDIAVGGGLRLDNAALVARTTRAHHFHGSVRKMLQPAASAVAQSFLTEYVVDPKDIRTLVEALRESDEGGARD
jgi:copper homeostasis protein